MTASQLDEIIVAADEEKCVKFFETITEPQRKALSSRALAWRSAINGYLSRNAQLELVALYDKALAKDIEFYQSIQSHAIDFPTPFNENCFPLARMAMLSTCGFPELKKAGVLGLPAPELAARLLQDRKPSWLDKWCAYVAKEFPATHWLALNQLEKSGACAIERNANYWMSMLCSLSNTSNMYETILTQDEKIIKELWDMLADPGVMRMLAEPEQIAHEIFRKQWTKSGNISASTQTGTRRGSKVWREALIRLAAENLIDRDRLIEYSFTALVGAAEKESKKSTSVSTADFAITLNRGLIEKNTASYSSYFASLLSATAKDVSTYASGVLLEMPVGTLCIEEICAGITPAFLNKSKEPADAALELLGRVVREAPSKRSEYGPAILAAFGHSSKDIHKKALALIESTNMLQDQTLLAGFQQRMDMLAGMERSNAAKLAAKYQGTQGTVSDTAAASALNANADELYARAKALDQQLRALAGIDEAVDAIKQGMHIDAPVRLDTLQFPRLNPDRAVKPIANLDDLIYMFTKVWSGNCTGMELEAVLDGVSRLCHERPPDFEQKTDALWQKAYKAWQDLFHGRTGDLVNIAFWWLSESRGHNDPPPTIGDSSGAGFFATRCLAISARAASKQSAPLLAAPTHDGGWIDPEALVKRILEYSSLNIEWDKADFIQALLRLAPDNRKTAMESAASVPGEIGAVLRYALGGSAAPKIETPEYWVAAFRATDPRGTCAELGNLMLYRAPDGAEAATYDFNLEPLTQFAKDRYASMSSGLPNFLPVTVSEKYLYDNQCTTERTGRPVVRSSVFIPTVILHDHSIGSPLGKEAFCWLHNRESLLSKYARRILLSIESTGSFWHGDYEWLFDPDVSMNENGRYVLCIAMSSKNNDSARLTVDALVAAVADCRIGGSAFGQAMANVIPSGAITTVRWSRGLRDMSRTSPLHAHFAWQTICALIEKGTTTATQQLPFLELLVELQIEHRFKPDHLLVQALSNTPREGKGAKLVKTILANGELNSELPAALQDLESRINRVERWQNWIRAGRREAVQAG